MTHQVCPSLLLAGIRLARIHKDLPELTFEDIRQRISVGAAGQLGVDFPGAETLIESHGWEFFSPLSEDDAAMRETLNSFYSIYPPVWRTLAIKGRDAVKDGIDLDEWLCLEIAGLSESISEDTILWWDLHAQLARQELADKNLRTGREGELRSFQYELQKLTPHGMSPTWASLQDNSLGYDILTYKSDLDFAPCYIEVKSSQSTYKPYFVYLSEGEAKFAEANAENWLLHYWNFENDDPIIFTWQQVEPHLPTNQNSGKWTSVRIALDG
jgi:hypothetical protein